MTARFRSGARSYLLAVPAAWLALTACSEETPPPAPGSFDRPTRVAFACFDVQDPDDPRPIALDACRVDATTPLTTRNALHALVVQSSRGEVAAVDLNVGRTLDSRPDIPSYTFMPVGELPIAIVVPPNAPDDDSAPATSLVTYVASAGSRDVTVVRTRAFRRRALGDETTVQTVPLPGDASAVPVDMVLSPDGDALFVSLRDAGKLLRLPLCRGFRALDSDAGAGDVDDSDAGSEAAPDAGDAPPDAGSSAPCVRGLIDTAAITEIPISESVSKFTPPSGEAPDREPYAKLCSFETPELGGPGSVPELPPDAAQLQPKPSGLTIDAFCERGAGCTRRLLVADEALPLIHVIDLDAIASGAGAVLAPIPTGAATRSVAVTPPVPVTIDSESSERTQYVYAIDAQDGSVLVTQDGLLLNVGTSSERRDRITLGSGGNTSVAVASSLSVLTPDFNTVDGPLFASAEDPNAVLPEEDPAEPYCRDQNHPVRSNRRLRGVFLAVSQSDGSIRLVDVHDMDLLECRSCTLNDDNSGLYDPLPYVRHRVRVATTLPLNAEDTPIRLSPLASAQFAIDSEAIPVRLNGTTTDPRLRGGLSCVSCPELQAEAFPDAVTRDQITEIESEDPAMDESSLGDCTMENQARVCALADPWGELDRWVAIYEGVLPGSRGGQGHFADPAAADLEFTGELNFCALGALGSADAEAGRAGDQLTITGPLPPDEVIEAARPGDADLLESCRELVRERDEDGKLIGFEIREAYADHLVLEPGLLGSDHGDDDAELVDACFGGMLLSYELRARQSYLVLGETHAGFVHSVVRRDDGRCVIDPSLPASHGGRAYPDSLFDNGSITFQVVGDQGEDKNKPPVDTQLIITLDSNTDLSVLDATISYDSLSAVVPADLRWSPTDSRLYLVDAASRGLVPVSVDPFPSSVSASLR